MKILGVELDANRLGYVFIRIGGDQGPEIITSGKLTLEGSREADMVRRFSTELTAVLAGLGPDIVAIKSKPESGRMRAGASALKMEALMLAVSTCEVRFTTPQSLKAVADVPGLYGYLQGAYKAAVVGNEPVPVKRAPAKPKAKTRNA